MKDFLVKGTLLLLFVVFTASSQICIESQKPQDMEKGRDLDALYLPSGPGLEFFSLGYKNALSNILWFRTIDYFGKHYRSDQNYRWLAHICKLVTTLDPRARHVYEFGASMLAWEANAPQEAIELLNQATTNDPDYWRYYFLRGFAYTFFMNDNDKAVKDFVQAAKLPGAPFTMARIAAKLAVKGSGDIQMTVELLKNMIENTTDPTARSALEARLKEILSGKFAKRV